MIINNIKQDWDVKIFNKNKDCPYIVIDNWYTKEEEENVWKELDYFSNVRNLPRGEDTIIASDKKGNPLGKHFRMYIDLWLTPEGRRTSYIFNYLYKQTDPQFHNLLLNASPIFRNFQSTNYCSAFCSYYEKDDHYDEHFDTNLFTCLIWFYKEPKKFEGGDFYLTEINDKIECKQNRMLLFPGYALHKVSPIKLKTNKKGNFGRYTITHFYGFESLRQK